MAIIMRKGLKINFDPNKMQAGELAVVTDTRELHATFAPGDSPEVLLAPETDGTDGQVLALEDGEPTWKSVASPTDAQVDAAVDDWLDAHPEATTTVQDGAITYAKLDSNLKGTVDDVGELKSDKADADGTYSTLTAGNLATDDGSNNNTPYLFRASGGGVRVGEREYDKIVGGTVAWNQIVLNGNFSNGTGYFNANNGSISASDGVLTYTANSGTGGRNFGGGAGQPQYLVVGHKYLYSFYAKINNISPGSPFQFAPLYDVIRTKALTANTDTHIIGIENCASVERARVFFYPWGASSVTCDGTETCQVHDVMLFDLTQMFGSTIADYVYGLGSENGVAKLKEWGFFTEPYYPYNAGELKSVEGLQSHEMVGKNLFHFEFTQKTINGVTFTPTGDGGVHVRGTATAGTTYSIAGLAGGPSIYDLIPGVQYTIYGANIQVNGASKGAMINKNTFTGDYINFVWLYVGNGETVNDVYYPQLEFGSEATDFTPYVKHTYPLDSDLTLRGILKLDSANQLYYDGDTYESDGTVTRRYGVIDLGSLEWTYAAPSGTATFGYFNANVNINCPSKTQWETQDGVNAKGYAIKPMFYIINNDAREDKGIAWYSSYIRISDSSYNDAATFKASLSGQYLVYALATSTSEEADPFASPQIVDEYGTEEYVTTGIVPVGHETFYPENLRQKIEGLPWNFASLIAPTEVTYKATQNYTSGSLFIVNNVLYKATANIANGGNITPGTNCTPTTLAAVIAAL